MSSSHDLLGQKRRLEVSPESFLIFSFISILAVPLAMWEYLNWSNLGDFLLIGMLVTVIIGGLLFIILFLIRDYISQLDQRDHFLVTLMIIALVGATRGVLLFFAFDLGGFQQPTDLHLRVITSTSSTLFWLVAISVAVEDTRDYQRKYRSILKSSILQLVSKDADLGDRGRFIPLARELRAIESSLNQIFDEAIRSTVNAESLIRSALKVRKTVDELIRPLSHRLWHRDFNQPPRIKAWVVIHSSIKFLRVKPFPIASFLALSSAFNLTSDLGALRGLIGSVTAFVVSYFALWFLARFLLEPSQERFIRNFLYLLFPGTLLGTVFYVTNSLFFQNDTGFFAYSYIVIVLIVMVLYSAREYTKSERFKFIQDLENDLVSLSSPISDRRNYPRKQVASFLHNSLQSELLALSYQLEDLAKNPDPLKSREVLEQLGSRINRSISTDFVDFIEDPLSRLNKLKSAWRGILDISLINQDFEQLNSEKLLLAVQIIEEAVSNAVRYSNAQNVSISIKWLSVDEVKLVIMNDGNAPTSGKSGLGTDWLNRYSPDKWSREDSDGKTWLELTL